MKWPSESRESSGEHARLIIHTHTHTHRHICASIRTKVGITDGFVRISCGIEDADDLIASLKQSLDALSV